MLPSQPKTTIAQSKQHMNGILNERDLPIPSVSWDFVLQTSTKEKALIKESFVGRLPLEVLYFQDSAEYVLHTQANDQKSAAINNYSETPLFIPKVAM